MKTHRKRLFSIFSFCYLQVLIPNIYRDVFLIFTDSYSLTEGSAKGVVVIKTLWTYYYGLVSLTGLIYRSKTGWLTELYVNGVGIGN